jgi:cyclase
VRDGKVVKGVNFEGVRDIGDPVLLGEEYYKQGADELVFYDITASHEGRGVMLDVVRRVAEKVFIPLCVGGGVSTVEDFREILRAGADKVSINSQAVKNPELIAKAADVFGCQCVVLGIDAKREDGHFVVYINGARINTGIDLIDWVKKVVEYGAGEICLNSIDTDGVRGGFDIEMLNAVCSVTNIPVIASGGLGKIEDFKDVFQKTNAAAGLGASLFHFGELTVADVKSYLKGENILVR